MNPDDEIFRQFIAKAIEIQAEKDSQTLSNEEMQQVAASMGITLADLEAAYNAYWQRGTSFARLNNWDDAIVELEQAVALKPDQPRVIYALANAYRKRWELTNNRGDQAHALALANRCAELDPSHFESLQLISELKSSSKPELPNPRRLKSIFSLASGLLFLGLVLMMMMWLFGQESSSTIVVSGSAEEVAETAEEAKPSNRTINESFALLGDRGPVYWLFTQKNDISGGAKEWSKNYYLTLINPLTGDQNKTITLLEGGDYYNNPRESVDIVYLGGKVYEIDEKNAKFIARDIYSGEIVEDNARLSQRFPALSAGIGKLEVHNGWFELVTTTGEKYWYAPSMNFFGSDTEKLEVNGNYNTKKGWRNVNQWVFTEGDVKKLYLINNQVSPYQMMFSSHQNNYEENEEMLQLRYRAGHTGYRGIRQIPNRTFISPKMIYASSALAVILHASEVGANAKPLLTCLDSLGNLRWYNDAPTATIFASRGEGTSSFGGNIEVYYHADKIVINNSSVYVAGDYQRYACELDLKTGRINWEYSPTAPKNN